MSSKHKHKSKHQAAHKPEDRLRRETPFLCSVKFRNGLPEVPCDPKMLISPLDTEGIAKFQLTTLEQQMRHDLLLDSGSGIQISMLDIDKYFIPDNVPPLHPDDAALLSGFNSAVEDRKGPARERLRGDQSELNWLMRTTYIAHDAHGKAKQKDALALSNGIADGAASREELLDYIETPRKLSSSTADAAATQQELLEDTEAGFSAAENPPRHVSNPSLEPVEILPVMPALEHWDDSFAHLRFDGDPTEDVHMLAGLSGDEKQRAAEHALLKSYNMTRDTGVLKLLALLLPRHGNLPAQEDSMSLEDSAQEVVYDMVREYDYRILPHQEHEQSYWFGFGDQSVTYGKVQNRIKTARNSKVKATPGYSRPSAVYLKRKAEAGEQMEERLKRQAIAE